MKKALFVGVVLFLRCFVSTVNAQIGHTLSEAGNDSSVLSHQVIVIVGSSTAAGTGPSQIDSAWVRRYRRYVHSVYPSMIVVNLAVGGYSTYECMPTGFIPPAGKAAPQPGANITKALSYRPCAIIVNLPTNDAYWNYTLTETVNNFCAIVAAAASQKIPIWVTTSQGRNLSRSGRDLLQATRDTIFSLYKDHAIDFWTGLADSDGSILPQYNSGDGVHMNSDAHKILCDRVIGANILASVIPAGPASVAVNAAPIDAHRNFLADHSAAKDTLAAPVGSKKMMLMK